MWVKFSTKLIRYISFSWLSFDGVKWCFHRPTFRFIRSVLTIRKVNSSLIYFRCEHFGYCLPLQFENAVSAQVVWYFPQKGISKSQLGLILENIITIFFIDLLSGVFALHTSSGMKYGLGCSGYMSKDVISSTFLLFSWHTSWRSRFVDRF